MNNGPIKGSAVIVFNEDKVLLILSGRESGHADGVYVLPSGSLDDGETYEEAAVREFNEETGLKTEHKYLVKLPTFYEAELKRKDGLRKFCAWSYYCTKYWGELKATDEGIPEWIKIEDIKNLELQVNVDKMIEEALQARAKLQN